MVGVALFHTEYFCSIFGLFAYSVLLETFCYVCRLGYSSWEQSSDKMEYSFVGLWPQKSWCQMPPGSDWKPLKKGWTFHERDTMEVV